MNSKNVSFKEKEEMKLLTPEEINTYFSSTQFKFGTAGIRGKMGTGTQRLNRFTYTQLADAYGEYVLKIFKKNKKIVIGHDNRKDSNTFAQICANVLSSKGIEVYLFHRNELMPTPIISYAIRSLNASGGIIVTASHNPKEYNGFKVYNPDGGQILPPVAEEITNFFVSNEEILNLQFKPKKSNISYIENSLIQEYFKDASQAIVSDFFDNEKKKYPIVFTGHHGTSCKLLPKFLKKFGFNIKPLASQCFYDSNFVNSPNSNPETIDSFEASIKYANEIDSKIIIGIDPDADRMAICIKHNNI
jgi:phosphomannomutase